MKKAIAIGLTTIMVTASVVGCSGNGGNNESTTAATTKATTEATTEATTAATTQATEGATEAANTAGALKTGLGVVTSAKSSKAATADADGNAQVDSVIATVTLDADGKILKCSIDTAQTKIPFTAAGVINTDKTALKPSKTELGENYGMKKASSIGKEWFEQAQAFADWTIGKTIDEVKGLQVKKVDDNHPAVPDVPELTSSVTVSVADYVSAIEKAVNNAKANSQTQEVSGDVKTGLGIITKIASSKDATADANGNAQVDSTIVAVTVDSTGKIVRCTIDAAQTKIPFSTKGELAGDTTAVPSTKNELATNYGLLKASTIGKEWFEQAQAFADWTIGKTIDEVKAVEVKKIDDGHPAVPTSADLTSSVTISVADFRDAIEKAVTNAK